MDARYYAALVHKPKTDEQPGQRKLEGVTTTKVAIVPAIHVIVIDSADSKMDQSNSAMCFVPRTS